MKYYNKTLYNELKPNYLKLNYEDKINKNEEKIIDLQNKLKYNPPKFLYQRKELQDKIKRYNVNILEIKEKINRINYCKECGMEFVSPKIKYRKSKKWSWKNDYCSKSCYNVTKGYPSEFNSSLKFEIRLRDGFKCKMCGKLQEEIPYLLNVHHIDHDKTNCEHSNLVSLCQPCHLKAHKEPDWHKKFLAEVTAK
ncbi:MULTISPECIES: HNH endonuclease [Methanobacterium]|uniref:HNH endonuclease n=1 Tax=Methanobacterium veterum TaxID=408577 RepID=A0A9E4ZUS7_9EURY|nr:MULTISPECIES: HNH endonuclease [Methanobacterium]MCZ3365401.1 HNH endonuclease [Methanobacterium veterum]MCZ3373152.1 HNH endonuclease [Methanobacterium veterum]